MGFPLLQKPAEMCVGRQIKVLGSYWKGRMSNEEANSLYLCTVRDYHALHKWDEVPDVFLGISLVVPWQNREKMQKP